jgi:hypothetical protein
LEVSVRLALSRRFRTKRMRQFVEWFGIRHDTRILDVGGTLFNWQLVDVRPRLTIVNVVPPEGVLPDGVEWLVADGRALPFGDRSFDVCFSNSVIEHVGTWDDQISLAREIRRVAPRYYVQTPNYWFPIEPHFMAPAIHWIPTALRRMLAPWTPWGLFNRSNRDDMEALLATRLITRKEMSTLFPEADIRCERFFGLCKSLVAVKL